MKILYLFLVSLFVLTSCSNDGFVKIDSLSHLGTTCFQGQKVPVWVSVDTDDKSLTKYEWTCSGGSFQDIPYEMDEKLYHNVWIAPMENGTYEVSCKVTCNGASEIRTTEIVVDRYLFYDFEYSSQINYFKKYDASTTLNNNRLLVKGAKGNTWGYVTSFVDNNPQLANFDFSVDIQRGSSYSLKERPMYFSFLFDRPNLTENQPIDKYVRDIRIEVYPMVNISSNTKKLLTSVSSGESSSMNTKHNIFVWCEIFDAKFGISTWNLVGSFAESSFYLNNTSKKASLNVVMNNVTKELSLNLNQHEHKLLLDEYFNNIDEDMIKIYDIALGTFSTNCQTIVDNWKLILNNN